MTNNTTEKNTIVDTSPLNTLPLPELLASRITQFAASPAMQEIIDRHVARFVEEVVKDSFCTWDNFGKGVKDAFKNALPGGIERVVDLGRYNAMIEERLRATFASSNIANDMIAKAEAVLNDVMDEKLLLPVIKLSTLMEAFIKDNAERAAEKGWDSPSLEIVDGSYPCDDYRTIYFDKEPGSSRNNRHSLSTARPNNRLSLAPVDGEVFEGEQVYRIYAAAIDDKLVQDHLSTDLIRRDWEKMMFALYYGQSKIIIDCDPDDFSYPHYD
ncbi:hypothetical protein F9U39_01195 [Pectobacterium versatile]|uniref:hypothetical protein n=1 Tax=Pectobacterium versatile TaxID=2488639 RepID=UPI001B391649|nr:hypothetical protein [Pectobacterium versatile]MBQ4788030.1 hypothetical protein [Pectobacterium versatile]